MKRLIIALLFVAAFAAVALPASSVVDEAGAQATMHECVGAPADYVAANDANDGVLDGKVSSPEPRAFLETQSHIQPPGVTERHHFEHIHIGACFPYAETWVQENLARTLDVRFVFHHVANYNVVSFGFTFVRQGGANGPFIATLAQRAELEAAMDASANGTTTVFQHYSAIKKNDMNCRWTARPELQVVRANADAVVDEWFAAGQWTTYIDYAGQGACLPEFQTDRVASRSWAQPGGGYTYSTIFAPPASQMDEPVSDPWEVLENASNNDVHNYVDPNFHVGGNLGLWHQDSGVHNGDFTISVPLADIPAGAHRLVYIGDRPVSDGTISQSAIQVVPFLVGGGGDGPACAPTCDEQIAALEAEIARLNDIIDRAALVLAEK